jgi:hypothetical protein
MTYDKACRSAATDLAKAHFHYSTVRLCKPNPGK